VKVFLTPRARADLRAIHKYLRAKSPTGAENVLRRIRGALLQLEDQPEIGMAVADTDVRRLYVGRYPYLAYYRLTGRRIDVVHIRHTSRADVEATDLE
jgi:plasmid stabilization system protein ParE